MQRQHQPGTHTMRATALAQGTAGTADTWVIGVAPNDLTVTAVRWIPNAAVTGAATNYFSLQLKNGSTGITTAVAYDSGSNSVALTSESHALSATAADLDVDADGVLVWTRTVAASGLASPDGLLEIDYVNR